MTLNKLEPGSTIGIIGGGQLGKMMAQSAIRMGYKTAVLDPDENCPASAVTHLFIKAAYNDLDALKQLGQASDVITYEFENINAEALKKICEDYDVPQGFETVAILQNRLSEKNAVKASGVNVVPFKAVNQLKDLHEAVTEIGYPFILKTVFGGYDGKGQIVINNEHDLAGAESLLEVGALVAEKMIKLKEEISITATRDPEGSIVFFPVQENIHRHQILYKTTVNGSHEFYSEAVEAVRKIVAEIHFTGTFTVEFFISEDNELFVNEIAPRPHNSGHYSIEACDYSQFDTHIMSLIGAKLPDEIKLLSSAVMYNLLGEDLDAMDKVLFDQPGWHVHLYGKAIRKQGRKMGHITILTDYYEDNYESVYKGS